ncbi:uncharacterized protein MJAP1_002474 [Malassezia japonica]|uniref:HIT domain-containing protein n=1 Tax=Malassezia japonica TaxID=223818 RepID=A0AAF0F2V1_9BASI|nr:uncharacterized protein MJAP1_002474 [Malassezia japonica]WFD39497.1 hypothetical protein MJAP1_002474 [Malassezia japonica]
MTSHLLDRLKSHDDRRMPRGECVFCDIIERRQPAYIVAETDDVIAFLDVLPIRAGHTLVVPKSHVKSISDLSPKQSASLMLNVVSVARTMEKAFGITGLQVAANQEYAQAVDHVHFHIVPAPLPSGSSSPLEKYNTQGTLQLMGRRDELGDEEGEDLANRMRTATGTLAKL